MPLSEGDEIRAGTMILKVVTIHRPEPQTVGWDRYVENVDNFLRQSQTKPSIPRKEDSGIPTLVDSRILGSVGLAGQGSYARVYKMIDTQGRLYGVKVPLRQDLDEVIRKELECLRKLSHVSPGPRYVE